MAPSKIRLSLGDLSPECPGPWGRRAFAGIAEMLEKTVIKWCNFGSKLHRAIYVAECIAYISDSSWGAAIRIEGTSRPSSSTSRFNRKSCRVKIFNLEHPYLTLPLSTVLPPSTLLRGQFFHTTPLTFNSRFQSPVYLHDVWTIWRWPRQSEPVRLSSWLNLLSWFWPFSGLNYISLKL